MPSGGEYNGKDSNPAWGVVLCKKGPCLWNWFYCVSKMTFRHYGAMTRVLEEASGTNPWVNRRKRRRRRRGGGGWGGGGKTDLNTYFHIATLNKLPLHDLLFKILKVYRMGDLKVVIQGGSNMTGTDLCVNKPHCATAVRPWESEATTSTLPPARVRTCSVLSGSC